MNSSVAAAVAAFINEEQLPDNYADTVEQWILPLVEELLQQVAVSSETYVIGISGCQGSGKSTLADLLAILMREMLGLNCISLSIDDFYLTRDHRQALAREIHPLLLTRGVPGTHEVGLAVRTIEALGREERVAIPRFNKAEDERRPRDQWPTVQGPVDVIVLEGWCIGIPPQDDAALAEPINALESEEDPDAAWRRHVNHTLRQDYPALFGLIDYLIMLRAPDFDKVYQWRRRQEEQLARKQCGGGSRIMDEAALARFIQHYERLTRHALQVLPEQADTVFPLTDEQCIGGRE